MLGLSLGLTNGDELSDVLGKIEGEARGKGEA